MRFDCAVPALLLLTFWSQTSHAAEAPRITANATPPVRKLDHTQGRIKLRVTLRPGVPKAGETVSIEIQLSEVLDAPDPTYGLNKPLGDASLFATVVQSSGRKRKKAGWIERRASFALPDAGTYGFTFTPPADGLYGLHLDGKTPAGPLSHSEILAVGTWPIPEGTKPALLPKKLPAPTLGNLGHGRALCDQHCKKDVPGALPAGKTPTFLSSAFAEAQDDGALLRTMTGGKASTLAPLEQLDLLYYLRSLHLGIRDLFPNAAAYTSETFTINEHGLGRLKEAANITLPENARAGRVFVVYKGEANGHPALIPYDDTVARDRLNKEDKVGYVLFLELPGEKKAKELGLALGLETDYPIAAVAARDATGKQDPRFNKQLAAFVGQGKFNDARSLRKGSKVLQKRLLPVYLKAAELATMYYSAEREFTAFDDEFE